MIVIWGWKSCSDAGASSIVTVFFRSAKIGACLKSGCGEVNELVFAHFSFGIIEPASRLLHVLLNINHWVTPQSIENRKNLSDGFKSLLKTKLFFIQILFTAITLRVCSLCNQYRRSISYDLQKPRIGLQIHLSPSSFPPTRQSRQILFF